MTEQIEQQKLFSAFDDATKVLNNCDYYLGTNTNYLNKVIEEVKSGSLEITEVFADKFAGCPIEVAFCDNRQGPPKQKARTTIQRFIRRNFSSGINISDEQLDRFSGLVSAIVSAETFEQNLKILKGIDIYKYYKKSGIHSCMAGQNSSYTLFYSLNRDKVQLVTCSFPTKMRALLWTTDSGEKVLDKYYMREYNLSVSFALMNWAIKNNIRIPRFSKTDGAKKYVVTAKHCGFFPYIDTMQFGRFLKGGKIELTNFSSESKETLQMTSQQGWVHVVRSFWCDECKSLDKTFYWSEVNKKLICSRCFERFFNYCKCCGNVFEIGKKCRKCSSKLVFRSF